MPALGSRVPVECYSRQPAPWMSEDSGLPLKQGLALGVQGGRPSQMVDTSVSELGKEWVPSGAVALRLHPAFRRPEGLDAEVDYGVKTMSQQLAGQKGLRLVARPIAIFVSCLPPR